MAESPRPLSVRPPPLPAEPEGLLVRLSRYRAAVHKQWSGDYRAWLRAHGKTEVVTLVGGAIAPAAAALVAYVLWPGKESVSWPEAIGIAAFLGVVGAGTALLALAVLTSLAYRLLAPWKIWTANQQTIKGQDQQIAVLFAELLEREKDEPDTPDFLKFDTVDFTEGLPGIATAEKTYSFTVIGDGFEQPGLRAICSGWILGKVRIKALSPGAMESDAYQLRDEHGALIYGHIRTKRQGDKSVTFEIPEDCRKKGSRLWITLPDEQMRISEVAVDWPSP